MTPATGIIKKSQVKPAGRRRLSGCTAAQDGDALTIEAHLLSSDGTRAIVEVVCGCGQRIEIICEYDMPAGAQGPPEATQEQSQPQQ